MATDDVPPYLKRYREIKQDPTYRAASKFFEFVDQCVVDSDFRHPDSRALLDLLLLYRHVLLDNFDKTQTLEELLEPMIERVKSYLAEKAAGARYANDTKQLAKGNIKVKWFAWRADPTLYKNQGDFARAMNREHKDVVAVDTIEGWCRDWITPMKERIETKWSAWQADPTLYESQGDFARAMSREHNGFISVKVIEGWCRFWIQKKNV